MVKVGAGLPTAMRETIRATLTYCSRNVVDTVNAAATLVKPSTAMSGGRYWLEPLLTTSSSFTTRAAITRGVTKRHTWWRFDFQVSSDDMRCRNTLAHFAGMDLYRR